MHHQISRKWALHYFEKNYFNKKFNPFTSSFFLALANLMTQTLKSRKQKCLYVCWLVWCFPDRRINMQQPIPINFISTCGCCLEVMLRELKLVVVGDDYTGKSSLIASFIKDKSSNGQPYAKLASFKTIRVVDDALYQIMILVVTSRDEFHRLRPQYYTFTNAFIVMFSLGKMHSFENVKKYGSQKYESTVPKPIVLVGNGTNLRSLSIQNNIVTPKMGVELAREINAVKYVECLSKTMREVRTVFDEAKWATLKPRSTARELTFSNQEREKITISRDFWRVFTF